MVVEDLGSEMAPMGVETVGVEVDGSLLNGKKESGLNEPIKFGSHGEEPVKVETNEVAGSNVPKDAVEEWPAPKQIHSFYFVRFRMFDDPKIKAKIDLADMEIQKKTQSRFQLLEKLKVKKSERADLNTQIKALIEESKQFKSILDEKKKEIEPLQQALGKLRTGNNAGRSGICSSEEELNDLIYSLQYRIQHESIPLTEEKQILREIKQLEGTREQVIANAAMRAKIQDSLGQKEAIQDQVKLMGNNLDGVKKERSSLQAKINELWNKRDALHAEVEALEKESTTITQKRDEAFANIKELRKQRDDANSNYFQSRNLLTKARELAAQKDVEGLKELSESEMEKSMSLWCNMKAFRSDYEKRLLPSLDSRQLSRDGRMRNPDEKPLLAVEVPVPEPDPKPLAKKLKEEPKPTPQKDALPVQKVQKTVSKTESRASSEVVDNSEEEEEIGGMDKVLKKQEKEIDEATLKELKREEEIAKAKQAMERKKKLAEKAAAKAAVRAQKEAEKKLKKLKKKTSTSASATDSEEPTEAAEGAAASEPEQVEGEDEASVSAPIQVKEKSRSTIRYKNRVKVSDSLPKAILRRKKSANYWLYAVPIAVAVLLLLVALGFTFLV